MSGPSIVLDTNVLVAALRSDLGASHRLLSLIGLERFDIQLSVPLVLEYEDVCKRMLPQLDMDAGDVDDIIDYLCSVAHLHEIYFLWRPVLRDAKDDMVLELAVTSGAEFIVTFNEADFAGTEQFGIGVATPREFLDRIGEGS